MDANIPSITNAQLQPACNRRNHRSSSMSAVGLRLPNPATSSRVRYTATPRNCRIGPHHCQAATAWSCIACMGIK